MYSAERARLREVFFRAWRNHRDGRPLEGIERIVVEVALKHPEYHKLLDDPAHHGERDFAEAAGEANPFLHLSMHIAIEEQVAIDQPRDVQSHYHTLRRRLADEHTAQHAMMDCLGEMLWHAQRDGAAPSESFYLDCLGHLVAPDAS